MHLTGLGLFMSEIRWLTRGDCFPPGLGHQHGGRGGILLPVFDFLFMAPRLTSIDRGVFVYSTMYECVYE